MTTDRYVVAEDLGHRFALGEDIVVALAGASFSIGPGDRIAVVGPSGSGKTSLMHLIAGLDEPTSGTISWPGLGPRESLLPGAVGFIAQAQSLVSSLDVLENIEMPLLFLGKSRAEAREKSLEILARLDLGQLAGKLPEELSGGQAKRVAAARALVTGSKLLLADEPTGQLDHETARRFLSTVFDMLAETDTAVVMTTHDAEVERYMRTLWSMDHGTLKARMA